MNEAVTKRFLLCFRLMLLVWILIVNSILHVVGFAYSWLIFLSNIMKQIFGYCLMENEIGRAHV